MRIGYSLVAATIVAASLTGCSSNDQSVFEMEVGMCFNIGSTSDTVVLGGVPTVACSEPHDAEVFFIYNLTGIEVFDQELVNTEAQNGCLAPFQDYVGADFYSDAATNLDLFSLIPSESSWAKGDREVVCSVTSINRGEQSTGSLKNSLG